MAGHSKWNNIKRTKGANDLKRGKAFSRISKDLELATKLAESGDPNFNPMLRVAIDKAKAANMPNDKIEKAINKGLGIKESDEIILENTYELYGPFNIAILVDTETDNPNRTITEIKTVVTKNGGKMVSEGSISWQFEEVGVVEIELKDSSTSDLVESLTLELLEVEGIKDVEYQINIILIIIEKTMFKDATTKIRNIIESNSNASLNSTSISKVANDEVILSKEEYSKLEEFIEVLEEQDDVINVWHNATTS